MDSLKSISEFLTDRVAKERAALQGISESLIGG
jgi:hypothetical protein